MVETMVDIMLKMNVKTLQNSDKAVLLLKNIWFLQFVMFYIAEITWNFLPNSMF